MIDSPGKKTMLRKENRVEVVDAAVICQEPVHLDGRTSNTPLRSIYKFRDQKQERKPRTVIKSIFRMMDTRYIFDALA